MDRNRQGTLDGEELYRTAYFTRSLLVEMNIRSQTKNTCVRNVGSIHLKLLIQYQSQYSIFTRDSEVKFLREI